MMFPRLFSRRGMATASSIRRGGGGGHAAPAAHGHAAEAAEFPFIVKKLESIPLFPGESNLQMASKQKSI